MPYDGFLHRYFLNNACRPLHKWLHYFDVYERHLERFRGKRPVMLEIGVSGGGSLAMWREYFGEGCQIIGVDIDPACKNCEGPGIEVVIGSQDDRNVMAAIKARHPRIDIILDDGSHIMSHMIHTFQEMYEFVQPHGIYIVEDLHTCYWTEYAGGLRRAGSFMEFAKDRLDELNAIHTRGAVPLSDFTRSTDAICFYDSIVVFERRPQGARVDVRTQPM